MALGRTYWHGVQSRGSKPFIICWLWHNVKESTEKLSAMKHVNSWIVDGEPP